MRSIGLRKIGLVVSDERRLFLILPAKRADGKTLRQPHALGRPSLSARILKLRKVRIDRRGGRGLDVRELRPQQFLQAFGGQDRQSERAKVGSFSDVLRVTNDGDAF